MSIDVSKLMKVPWPKGSSGCLKNASAADVRDALNKDKEARKDLRPYDFVFPYKDGKSFEVLVWVINSQEWVLLSEPVSRVYGSDQFLRLKK